VKAASARKLRVGDWVTATFSGRGVVKACEIIEIRWPTFVLSTRTAKGSDIVRERLYRSLGQACDPPGTFREQMLPSWLSFKKQSK
jgi:hypothetical protein